ncbi:hypothetical protein LCGC14_2094320 [marine sediment metagenome]|uniref:Uncharacterized protein n=1 Tax=marine sediment metagenome TaxID=412755 RepID=A0A0F9H8L5_9ZZZZ
MIIIENGVSKTLVQVTNENNGTVLGLYLVPKNVSVAEFEIALINAESQDDFDCDNILDVQRITAYNSILDINY